MELLGNDPNSFQHNTSFVFSTTGSDDPSMEIMLRTQDGKPRVLNMTEKKEGWQNYSIPPKKRENIVCYHSTHLGFSLSMFLGC